MKLNIVSAGVISIEGKPSEKENIRKTCDEFGKYADIDFCVDESNEDETCIVGTYHKVHRIEDIRDLWRRFKKERKTLLLNM